ncbi:hypothetical protein SLEP1_g14884 [Rubroshorea leprosula]|uniref:NB-ARC domain-containing protein n=1 Tax=Rubroshorea leprosula TaxID=152421 RepID=A0AAV5ITH3_9ROSI|nr:hypothetical protein SLEP1_g14884 [Rubroshorea leprosula]
MPCNKNVENLKKEVDKLKIKQDTVKRHIEELSRQGEEIGPKLQNWLNRAEDFIEVGDKLLEFGEQNANNECFCRLCPNPLSRYKLSKKAQLNSKYIDELVKEAGRFNLPNCYALPYVATTVEGFEEFPSRMAVLDQIMEALKSPIVNMIGVHGTSGVGKTMLVKEDVEFLNRIGFLLVVQALSGRRNEVDGVLEDYNQLAWTMEVSFMRCKRRGNHTVRAWRDSQRM